MRLKSARWFTLVVAILFLALCFTGCLAKDESASDNESFKAELQAEDVVVDESPAEHPALEQIKEEKVERKPGELVLDGGFNEGKKFWSNRLGEVNKENGNHYITNDYNWGVSQYLEVKPGDICVLNARVRRGTAHDGPARMAVIYLNDEHTIMPNSLDIFYEPKNDQWNDFPEKVFKIPEDVLWTKLYLLSNGHGTYDFDDVSVIRVNGTSYEGEMKLTVTGKEYVVKPGDTLKGIADNFDVSIEELRKFNNISDSNELAVGQTLKIPQN